MKIVSASLEEWMREYYFDVEIDVGSSGVEPFSLHEIRAITGVSTDELDAIVFRDSRTFGDDRLRRAIANRCGDGRPERVMATHGSNEALFLLMNALLEPGDELITLYPGYQQLFSTAEAIGCGVRRWPLRFENGFAPDPDELRRLITPKTKMVTLNFPHNPTGAAVDPTLRREIASIADSAGLWVIWDEAFAELTYESRECCAGPSHERSIQTGTLSKAYGAPGLRVGWCIAGPVVLNRCAHLRDYITLHLSPLVEHIASRILECADEFVGRRLREVWANLATVTLWAKDVAQDVEWIPPRGGVCAFPRLGVPDVDGFCRFLASRYRVLLVPGSCFGAPQHVRLGFGCSSDDLQKALVLIKAALKDYLGNSVYTAQTAIA